MRLHVPLLLLLLCLLSALPAAAESYLQVRIADPYIELHTGPGRGFPIFHVVDRGETVEVLRRRTDWFKVRTHKGKEGWANRSQMEQTLTASGEKTRFVDATAEDFAGRRWEMGLSGGDFDGANVVTVNVGYSVTENLIGEVSVSEALGDFSNSILLSASLVAQPFPEWRASPFFRLGTGLIYTDPQVTLVDEEDRIDQAGHVGAGVRFYLGRRFFLRAEYTNYVIFQDKDDNQEINEWKAGIAFFF